MKQSMVGSEKQNQIGTAFAMGKNTRSKVGMIEKQLFHGCNRRGTRTVEGRVIAPNSINSEIWQVGCKRGVNGLRY